MRARDGNAGTCPAARVMSQHACRRSQNHHALSARCPNLQAPAASAVVAPVQEIANDILTEQTPKKLHAVRGKVYELLINVVPPELVLRQLTQELLKKLDDEVKHQVRCLT